MVDVKQEIVAPIEIPVEAQQLIMQMIKERDAAQQTLDRSAAVLLAALNAPNGWYLQFSNGVLNIVPKQ